MWPRSTPLGLHPTEGSCRACGCRVARGLPLYLEKPVARSLADARAIVTAAEAGVVCAVGYQWHAVDVLATCGAA